MDYPFTLFEMHFDQAGKGEGKMSYALQINFDKKKNNIELENYSQRAGPLEQPRAGNEEVALARRRRQPAGSWLVQLGLQIHHRLLADRTSPSCGRSRSAINSKTSEKVAARASSRPIWREAFSPS